MDVAKTAVNSFVVSRPTMFTGWSAININSTSCRQWWTALHGRLDHLWTEYISLITSVVCCVIGFILVACWTEDTIQTLSAGLVQGPMWSCIRTQYRAYLLSVCVTVSCLWQKRTRPCLYDRPRPRCSSFVRTADRFRRTFFHRVCTPLAYMEPAARKDQECSVAFRSWKKIEFW